MSAIKLVAFDLDFTLLDSEKQISSENIRALEYISSIGIIPVVATGRLYDNIPEQLKSICRYYILSNGATIYDSKKNLYFCDVNIPVNMALQIYTYGDTLPCVYDAYIDNHGYMSSDMYDTLGDYIFDKKYLITMKEKRTPLPSLKQFITDGNHDVQKIQFYFSDIPERERQISLLSEVFPNQLYVSKSLANNIEINLSSAVKGNALQNLCDSLNVPISSSVGFGDGTNDISLIKNSGIGVCMCNGDPECLSVADIITEYDCNNSGFARQLMELVKYQ